MEIDTGTSGGAPASLEGDWVLGSDASTGRFLRRFTFSLPTAGLAERLRWQPSTRLVLYFPSFEYDARNASAPEGVTVQNHDGGVRLTFPSARTLFRVKVAGATSGDWIEAYRTDGDVTTDDPFAKAKHGPSGADLTALDRLLVLKQTGTPGANLTANEVQQVWVRSAAANVRVGVQLPALGSDVFYLPPAAGSVLTEPTQPADLGPGLAAVLEAMFDRYADTLAGGLLPGSVPLVLSIESDTPTLARINDFVLSYRLYRSRFADGAAKRTLDFAGGARQVLPLLLDVPGGGALWSATLRMMGSFVEPSPDPTLDSGGENGGAPEATSAPAASDQGIALRVGESAAARLPLEQAALVQALLLDLVALAEASAGRVRLQRDAGGQPGEVMAEALLPALGVAKRRLARVDFDPTQPPLVSAGPAWVTLQCDTGAFLWMTPSGTLPGHAVSRRTGGDLAWVSVPAAAERGASLAVVTAAPVPNATADDPNAFHGVRLYSAGIRLRGAAPPPGARGQKETHFSVAPALAPLRPEGAHGSLIPIELSLVSSERGRVTVYPPEFEFDP